MSIYLPNLLTGMNTSYVSVTNLITNKFNFFDQPDVFLSDVTDYDYIGMGNALCIQSDGKVVVGGISGLYDGDNYTVLKRFNANGSLDETFTSPKFYSNDGHIREIVQQSSGKLIVIGHFQTVNSDSYKRIVRLNTNGSIDNTFVVGNGLNNTALVCKVLSDDSLLVGGTFSIYDGNSSDRLVKLGVNGAFESTFTSNMPSFSNNVYAIAINSGGDIYVGGEFSNRIVKLSSDGTTDVTFDVGSGFDNRVNDIQVQSNGKVIVGGWFISYKGSSCNKGIVRLETNGDLDSTFQTSSPGLAFPDDQNVQNVAIQSDGKILAGGWFYAYNEARLGRIIRFNSNGTKDDTFLVGEGFNDRVQKIRLDNSGNIFCAGFFYRYKDSTCTVQFNYLNSDMAGGCAKLNSVGDLVGTPLKSTMRAMGINDGGDDMYDGGSFFNTNLTNTYESIQDDQSIPFTHSFFFGWSDEDETNYDIAIDDVNYDLPSLDGTVEDGSSYFGSGSTYFTNMYPGLLVLGASNISIEEFSITGNTGQDGNGDANTGSIDISVNGSNYAVFYKTSYDNDSDEPAINQIIIVDGVVSGITQNFENLEQDCDQILTGLTGRKELYVLTFGRIDQTATSEEDITLIAQTFLGSVATEVTEVTEIRSCSKTVCTTTIGFPCHFSTTPTTSGCTCAKWKFIYPQCTRSNIAAGNCNGKAGAYVAAITVCNQRLF